VVEIEKLVRFENLFADWRASDFMQQGGTVAYGIVPTREWTLPIQRRCFSAGSKLHLRQEILRNLPKVQSRFCNSPPVYNCSDRRMEDTGAGTLFASLRSLYLPRWL
jgi:hypothetical protein